MTYRLEAFADVGLDEALLKVAIADHRRELPRLDKLWAYYRNPLQPVGVGAGGEWSKAGRWYRQAQECGTWIQPRCRRSPKHCRPSPRTVTTTVAGLATVV